MARVPCVPVPGTGRQGTIEVLKYVILLPWHAKPRNPTEVVHVWTTIPVLTTIPVQVSLLSPQSALPSRLGGSNG